MLTSPGSVASSNFCFGCADTSQTLMETRHSCWARGAGTFTYLGEFSGSEKLGEFHPSEDVFRLFQFHLDGRFEQISPRLRTEKALAENEGLNGRNGVV